MAEGFIFNHNRCVGCKACSAACFLENGWTFVSREVYTYNSIALPVFPVINISLACNHCRNAVCFEGCPASAYFREPSTGAVIIDDSKCIGCRYCQWNCPYDAPKYQSQKGVVGKCNFCHTRLQEGKVPACTSACPTGALAFGIINQTFGNETISWFPDKNLEPGLELRGNESLSLKIFPRGLFESEPASNRSASEEKTAEWSLIAFSFLTILSVAKNISSLIRGTFPDTIQFIAIILLAGVFSLFHLGKKDRVWRAVANIRSSPLSREIALFILYAGIAVLAVCIQIPFLLILSSVIGLLLLLSIDSVYLYSDNRKSVYLHSGQAFLTGLLVVSFITDMKLPFAFIGVVKLALSLISLYKNRYDKKKYSIRFIRSALLVITGTSLISNISYPENPVLLLFLAGELMDRILFYLDFKPLNINRLLNSGIIGSKV